jgi:hypothetical protein
LADNGSDTQSHALLSGSSALDAIPDGVNGCGDAGLTDQRGIPRPNNGACDIGAYEYAENAILYVDADASGAATGGSWTDAFPSLQDALSLAPIIINKTEIWVAEGVYYPDEGTEQVDDDRTSTFTLSNRVEIYGGFTGTETDLTQRDWQANVTVLSGDIDADAGSLDTNADENFIAEDTGDIQGANALHVVSSSGVTATAILDGFTITAGHANGAYENGAGLYNDAGSPTLSNLIFRGNLADWRGGAIANMYGSSPTFTNIAISGNSAGDSGGAMFNRQSNPTMIHVTIAGNYAGADPGGIYNWDSSTMTITNSILWGNWAADGDAQILNENNSDATVSYTVIPRHAGDNNIHVDPQFFNDYDDLRLTGVSPAIDSGFKDVCPSQDIRGENRDDWHCDIGAYEAQLNDTDTVTKTVASGSTYTFGPTLAKVEVVDDGSCLTDLSIQRVEAHHPSATTGLQTGRYWVISPVGCVSGFDLSLTLPYSNTITSDDKLCRYDTSIPAWDCGAAGEHFTGTDGPATMPDILTRQNVAALSAWAVGRDVGPTAVTLVAFRGGTPSLGLGCWLFSALGLLGGIALGGRQVWRSKKSDR